MSPARVGSTFADTTSATGGENLTWPPDQTVALNLSMAFWYNR
jgi:hypothetical protein